MKEIKLTNSPLMALVDDSDFDKVSQFTWMAYQKRGDRVVYARTKTNGTPVQMHTIICPQWNMVDHKDCNGLNNQRDNLRESTKATNGRNRRKQLPPSSSQYKGVYKRRGCKNWTALIRHEGKQIYLGRFANEKAAAAAYNSKAQELHGEFARLNEL